MRPLSSTMMALVSALTRERGVVARLLGGGRDDVATLAAIAAQPEAAAVPLLTAFLLETGEVASAAARALAGCVAVATPDELMELDEQCRRTWWSDYPDDGVAGWRSLRASDVTRLVTLTSDAARVVGVATFHPDGKVREEAVRQLAEMSGEAELPFLLIRLNDWVEQVARRAEGAVRQRLTMTYMDALVDNLAIVLRLGTKRRRPHQALIDAVLALLIEPESRPALERGLGSAHHGVRRLLFRAALAVPASDRIVMLERALSNEDSVIRTQAARIARRDIGAEALARLLPRMLRDPYPTVRCEGIAGAAELRFAGVDAVLFEALLDRSLAVRETARFCLRRYHHFDGFSAYYRERLVVRDGAQRVRVLTSAIAGLGESGAPSDVDVLVPFLGDARPHVRVASVRAIAMLAIDASVPLLLELLGDPSPVVTCRVRQVLSPKIGGVSAETLQRLTREIPFAHGRLDTLRLAMHLRKWDAIVLLLEHVRDPDAEMRAAAQLGAERWVAKRNASFEQPTRVHLHRLRTSLATHRWTLPAAIAHELDAIIHYWEVSLPIEA